MTEYSKNISFWSLLASKKIVIPIIQRDYAQGRIGKEYLRERFLGQLFAALQGDAKPLVLDFVYGSVEADTFYSARRSATSDYVMAAALVFGFMCGDIKRR